MLNITVIAVGKMQKDFLWEGCNRYIKRMGAMCSFRLIELEDEPLNEKNLSRAMIDKALEKEGDKIIASLPKQSYNIALCIEGKQISSTDLAQLFEKKAVEGYSGICFIIGSSHGLAQKVKDICRYRLSFSKMTFPHQMARLMLAEQIYRALSINAGTKYHK